MEFIESHLHGYVRDATLKTMRDTDEVLRREANMSDIKRYKGSW